MTKSLLCSLLFTPALALADQSLGGSDQDVRLTIIGLFLMLLLPMMALVYMMFRGGTKKSAKVRRPPKSDFWDFFLSSGTKPSSTYRSMTGGNADSELDSGRKEPPTAA